MKNPNTMILAVDDDPVTLRLVTLLLRQENYTVLAARDGVDALYLLNKHCYIDLILADVDMPGMTGFELLRVVRQKAAWSHIPFLFLSMREAWTDMHYAKTLGGDCYLTKPVTKEKLLGYVASCLSGTYARFRALE